MNSMETGTRPHSSLDAPRAQGCAELADVGEEHERIVFSWAKEGTGRGGGRNVMRMWGDAMHTWLALG